MPSPLLIAASRMRGVLAVGRKTTTTTASKATPSLLKKNTFVQALRLTHAPTALPSQAASYRISSLSTVSNSSALTNEGSSSPELHTHNASSTQGDTSDAGSGSSHPPTHLSAMDRAYLAKYRKPTFTPEIDQEIIRLRQLGKSWSAVGSELGLPHRSCHRRWNSLLDPELDIWNSEMIEQLESMVAEGKSWQDIAQSLGSTSTNCQAKWKSLVKPEKQARNRQFDTLQSKVLMSLVEEFGEDDWKKIMREFMMRLGGRDMAKVTPEQLRHQFYRMQRRPSHIWSLHEETALIQHVLKNGTNKWDLISEALQFHSPEQCKEKWTMLDMKHRIPKEKAWYKAERGNFWRLYQRYGQDWDAIAGFLPKRPPHQCEAFFNKATAAFSKDDPEEFNNKVKVLAELSTTYNTVSWKKDDSDHLWRVVEEVRSKFGTGRVDWHTVAEIMDMKLTPDQYKHHHYYLKLVQKGGISGPWTEPEIRTLERAVAEVGRNWNLISERYLPKRNPKSLCHKFSHIKFKGSHISPEEYEALLAKVELQEEEFNQRRQDYKESSVMEKFTPNWRAIAKTMPGGLWTPDQCKDAYESSFKNHIKNSIWTHDQDNALLKAVQQLGRKNWIGVAALFPSRNTWECRMRWSELHEPILEDKDAQHIMSKATRRIPIGAV